MIKLSLIQKDLQQLFSKKIVSGKVLLNDCKFLDEDSRKTPAYNDPLYAPFYYHLGKFLKPKSVFSWNFGIGFLEKCFFMSCKDTEEFFAFQKKTDSYFPPRIGISNVKKTFKKEFKLLYGSIHSESLHNSINSRKWDCFFITEQNSYDDLLFYLELSWENLADNGVIVVEYVHDLSKMKSAFHAFAKNYNVNVSIFKTRYGTGILQK